MSWSESTLNSTNTSTLPLSWLQVMMQVYCCRYSTLLLQVLYITVADTLHYCCRYSTLLLQVLVEYQQPDSIQNSSHLLPVPHCVWYSSSNSMPLGVASALQSFSLSQFTVLGWGPWGRDPFIILDLWSGTLNLSLLGILRSPLFKSKLKTHLFSFAHWFVIFSLLIIQTHHQ